MPPNHFANFYSMHICLPIKIKSTANNNNNVNLGTITVNTFMAHWLKEVDIKRYDDIQSLPIRNTVDLYRYSDAMLKHKPGKAVEMLKNSIVTVRKM